jgi:hypothetical protein
MLLKWGLERCNRENLPIYLESTVESVSWYEKHGFQATSTISLRLCEHIDKVYEEIGLMYEPTVND